MKRNMNGNYFVSRATLDDLDEIASLFDQYRMFYGQVSDLAGAVAFLGERIKRSESVIFLIEDEETKQAIGFTQLYPSFSSISMQSSLILNDLFVLESFRGQGVAYQLMEAARLYAVENGAKGLELSTAKDNFVAQRLYESLGYERDEQFYHYFFTNKIES